jgi:hypothetical protein
MLEEAKRNKEYSENSVIQINVKGNAMFFLSTKLFKIGELWEQMKKQMTYGQHDCPPFSKDESRSLFYEGIDCDFLGLGNKEWQKGRLRLKLEFIPEQTEENIEPIIESSNVELDEIRKMVD